MKIVQASTKRVYEVEGKPVLRVLSSGIKLTDFMMKAMGLSKGDKVSYAEDEDDNNKLYLFKTDGESGSILGSTKAFTNSGLLAKLKVKAGAVDLKIKGGNHIVSVMDAEGVESDGVMYFGINTPTVEYGDDTETADEPSIATEGDEFE